MRRTRYRIRLAILAGLALGLPACAEMGGSAGNPPAPPPAAASTVLDDQLLGQVKRGETTMAQVRALIPATPIVNYQAGREIWIYQGVAQASGMPPRTVTVQYDERGVVRNLGVTDLN